MRRIYAAKFLKVRAKSIQLLGFSFCLASAVPAFADDSTADFARAHFVATFGEYNLASNVTSMNGNVIITDSLRDVVMVRGINTNLSIDMPTSAQPQYVLPLSGDQFAVSDPANDMLSVFNWRLGRRIRSFHYTANFGPFQMAYDGRTIFGSNRFDQLLTRFDTTNGRAPAPLEAHSGPTEMTFANGGTLYLVEEGVADNPSDDYVVWYKQGTGQRLGQQKIFGTIKSLVSYGNDLCMVLSYVNELKCGLPENDTWVTAPTRENPWAMATVDATIWVLTRGVDRGERPMLSSYVKGDAGLTLQAEYSLDDLAGLSNPRHLSYDATTRSLLVRGNQGVVAVPLN